MNWLDAFFAWLFRLPRVPALAALARTYLNAVVHDLEHHPEGSLDPDVEHRLRHNCGGLIFTAQSIVAAYILCRAREIAGLHVTRPHWDFSARPRRLPAREALHKRAGELLRRLDRAERHARKLAETLTTSELDDLLGALSNASPAEAGAQPHLGRVRSTPSSSFDFENSFERFAHFLGATRPRPPPGTRLSGCALDESPALAA